MIFNIHYIFKIIILAYLIILSTILPMIWIPLIFTLFRKDPIIGELKDMRDRDKKDLRWKNPPMDG